MKFNKFEKFLVKILNLNNKNKPLFFKSLFKYFNFYKSDLSQPDNISKSNNLNQPIKKKDNSGKNKKAIITFIIVFFVLVFFVLVGLSGYTYNPRYVKVESISSQNKNDSFVVNTDKNQKITIATFEEKPTVYSRNYPFVEVTFTKGVFNTFYFSGILDFEEIPNSKSNLNNNQTSSRIQTLSVANLKIFLQTGDVFVINKNKELEKDNNLTASIGQILKGTNISTTKPIPFSFSAVTSILVSLLPLFLIFGFLLWSLKRMSGGGLGQDNVFSIGKSQAKIANSNTLFSDVAGIEEEKEELIEIVDYLKNPEKYANMGARVPKGVILYGPPGTGKTLLAKAVAGEAKVPFFQVSGSAFEDMLVGVGAKRVRDLFSKAIKAAPAIIFIDEIDSVGSKRGKFDTTTSGSLADQTLNQLLAEMDGFSTRTGVIVIAATNRLDVLDDALLRPGRFDRHIRVNLPDIKERTSILKIHSKNKNISSTVDLEDIARRTPGFSGAQLENVLNEATILAVRKREKSITLDDLDEAIDRVIAGPAKKTKVISLEEKRQIAYHEAGHAIVGLYTKGSEVVEKITIIPRGQAAGYTLSVPEIQELSIQKKSDLLGMVAGLLGGRASEEIVFGKDNISTGAANDFYKATNIVRSMVTQLGMSSIGMAQYYPSEGTQNPYQSKLFSEATSVLIDKEIEKIFSERYEYASKIIKENRKELDLIVDSLLLLETIVKPQIDFIHKYKKLPIEALEKKQELENKKKAEELIKESKESQKTNLESKKNN